MLIRRLVLAPLFAGALFLAACNNKVNDQNFEKVKDGMTVSEVQSVLGEGEKDETGGFSIGAGGTMGSSSSAGSSRQTYVWKEDTKQIVIEFKDGKVVSKRK